MSSMCWISSDMLKDEFDKECDELDELKDGFDELVCLIPQVSIHT